MKPSSAAMAARVGLVFFALALLSCSRPVQGHSAEPNAGAGTPRSLRVLVTGDVAGMIEPCGCVKDQLGGLDRFATAVLEGSRAQATVFLESGSLFYPRPHIDNTETDELLMRAETLADGMRQLGLVAWVPGDADLALDASTIGKLATRSGASSLQGTPPQSIVREVAGVKLGIFGLHSQSTARASGAQELANALQSAASNLQTQGAKLKIALVDAPLSQVTRALHQSSEFQLVVVSATDVGLGADSDGAGPQLIGSTLVVSPPNHLRGLVSVDFTIKGGIYEFEDGTGVGREEQRVQFGQRIVELAERLKQWKQQGQTEATLAAREADLKRMREKLADLSKPLAKPTGSHFSVGSVAIDNKLEHNPDVKRALDALGRRVNLGNRDKFAGRKAPPAVAGEPTYVGVKVCETCHKEAATFWRTTRHSGAYKTLADKDRQYTLECVGCHVTGYEQPGGSSITDVDRLKDVQCETCHGPGSAHANANNAHFIQTKPERDLCATKCHHSPHVDASWTVSEAWPKIIGKGHGE